MAKFRKKPVVIEAIQYTGDNLREVLEFTSYQAHVERDRRVFISTLEGVMEATPGDWIIRGIHGEHYPCKPDIFAATYEPAEETSPVREAHKPRTVTHIPDSSGLTLPQLVAGKQALYACSEDPSFDDVRRVIAAVAGATASREGE